MIRQNNLHYISKKYTDFSVKGVSTYLLYLPDNTSRMPTGMTTLDCFVKLLKTRKQTSWEHCINVKCFFIIITFLPLRLIITALNFFNNRKFYNRGQLSHSPVDSRGRFSTGTNMWKVSVGRVRGESQHFLEASLMY